ncbi:SDR family NAD(P)-dependent oxidoreductase [Histidinibacterium aquaticum]|uniref:SDR family oxidoreductase n=1 Tax=Histidinibacterium aquaticum TaxID=2613962 RepID=A0A5J5GKG0_9RHOB|nr:SDR family oxidoreductase [Histidinibacterium aquaticum]KAA9008118.1 SDR family oxidoreductase [Histidinibacterium aquaticum]
MRLAGKRAVVTGGSEGIGLAIARSYLREGAEVTIVGRSVDKLGKALETLGGGQSVAADLATDAGVAMVVETVTQGPPLDILVNNAGRAILAPFEEVARDDFEALMALNVTAPYFLTQHLLRHMVLPGGCVLNISSYFADKMIPGRPSSAYSVSKGAMDALTKTLAFELGPRGLRVNAIAPGTTDTEMRRRTVDTLPETKREALDAYVRTSYPLGRIGQPEDIAGLAVYLASDEAVWTSGAIIPVDGGYTCG